MSQSANGPPRPAPSLPHPPLIPLAWHPAPLVHPLLPIPPLAPFLRSLMVPLLKLLSLSPSDPTSRSARKYTHGNDISYYTQPTQSLFPLLASSASLLCNAVTDLSGLSHPLDFLSTFYILFSFQLSFPIFFSDVLYFTVGVLFFVMKTRGWDKARKMQDTQSGIHWAFFFFVDIKQKMII
jgi:hypothetical protein